MYLSVRSVLIQADKFAEAADLSGRAVKHIHRRHHVDMKVSLNVIGSPNRLTISSRWEALADYQNFVEAMQGDAKYAEIASEGNAFMIEGSETSGLHNVLRPLAAPSNFVTATLANMTQNPEDSITWGLEIAEYVTDRTGHQVGMLGTTLGDRTAVAWIMSFQDLKEFQTMTETMEQDPGYISHIKRAAGLFTEEGYTTTLARFIA